MFFFQWNIIERNENWNPKKKKNQKSRKKHYYTVNKWRSKSSPYLFVEPRVGHLVEPLAVRHVIVVLFGELEQYARGRPGHRVRSLVVHLLAYGRRFLQVQLVAGRDEKRALGQKVSRVGQLGRPVVVLLLVATAPAMVQAVRRPSVVRTVIHVGLVDRWRQWRRRRFSQAVRTGCRGAHVTVQRRAIVAIDYPRQCRPPTIL